MNLWRSGYGLMATDRLSSDEEASLPLANYAFPLLAAGLDIHA